MLQIKVAKLREFFGTPAETQLIAALEDMLRAMHLPLAGSLPQQVDKLCETVGIVVSGTAPVAPSGAACYQMPPAGTSAATATAAARPSDKHRLVESSPTAASPATRYQVPPAATSAQVPPAATSAAAATAAARPSDKHRLVEPPGPRQRTLFEVLPDVPKITVVAQELQIQRDMAAQGKAYSPREQDMRTFDSERRRNEPSADVVKPVKTYRCPYCPITFAGPAALASHTVWHASGSKPKVFATPLPPPPSPHVDLRYTVRGDGHVTMHFQIEGVAVEEIEAGRVAAANRNAERQKLVSAESSRRQRKREAEAEVESGEHRGGSAKRHSYSVKQKLEAIDVCDRIYLDPAITNKGEAWVDSAINPKFYGTPFGNLSRWRNDRRALAVAAAQEHASTLLRIDRTSRKVGKYAAMERQLFDRFKARRARARKASPRWLTHMAR